MASIQNPLPIILMFFARVSVVNMFEPGCSKPLGLMNGEIEDWQLAASSERENDSLCQTKYARLHQPGSQAWCPSTRSDTHHWILVDLGVSTEVSGLIVQGRGDELEWVTVFSLAVSEDAFKWNVIHDVYGKKQMFRGNSDSHHIRTVWLDVPVTARFVRIHVLEWHRHPSLRLEILGCQACAAVISGPGIGGGLTASSFGPWTRKNSCQPEDGHIDTHRAWCSKQNNANQWLQLELGPPTTVTGILTRGRGDTGRKQWVKSFTISYSNDTTLWYYYKEVNHLTPKIFGGNMDKSTERRHYFNSPFVARFVRVHPKTWHHHISLRAAALGCLTSQCPPDFFRLNPLAPCIQNLAYKKEVWSNDKKHFWKDWKFGHASLAVDGSDNIVLPNCAVLDNYYADTPIWMVDLGGKSDIHGIVIVTWQGDGQDKVTTFRDYAFNLEKFTVYISNRPRLDSSDLETEPVCGVISRTNNALFHTKLRFECFGSSTKGRYVYVHAKPVPNRWNNIFNLVLCEVLVY